MIFDLYSVFRQIVLNVKHAFYPHLRTVRNRQSSVLQQYLVRHGIPLKTSTGLTSKVKANPLLARTELITSHSRNYKVTGFMPAAVGPNSPRAEITRQCTHAIGIVYFLT